MDYALPQTRSRPAHKAPAGHPEETRLIEAAQAGDREAFSQLMQCHQQRLYAVASYLLGDSTSAADATQEAMLAAYRSLGSFRNGSLRKWLLRIVTHKSYDILRDIKRRRSVSWEAFTDDDPGLTVREDGPEAVVQRRELAQRLEASLAALSFHERQMVVLSDIHGLSYVEIAESTGRPVGTVKSRLSRARSKLREALRNDPAL